MVIGGGESVTVMLKFWDISGQKGGDHELGAQKEKADTSPDRVEEDMRKTITSFVGGRLRLVEEGFFHAFEREEGGERKLAAPGGKHAVGKNETMWGHVECCCLKRQGEGMSPVKGRHPKDRGLQSKSQHNGLEKKGRQKKKPCSLLPKDSQIFFGRGIRDPGGKGSQPGRLWEQKGGGWRRFSVQREVFGTS